MGFKSAVRYKSTVHFESGVHYQSAVRLRSGAAKPQETSASQPEAGEQKG